MTFPHSPGRAVNLALRHSFAYNGAQTNIKPCSSQTFSNHRRASFRVVGTRHVSFHRRSLRPNWHCFASSADSVVQYEAAYGGALTSDASYPNVKKMIEPGTEGTIEFDIKIKCPDPFTSITSSIISTRTTGGTWKAGTMPNYVTLWAFRMILSRQ